MLKINLGSGANYRKEYVNIDANKNVKADLYLNLETDALPYPDSSVDYILMMHVLEHIQNIVHLLNECHRILKPDGILELEVPNAASLAGIENAFGDIFHVRFFSPTALWMLTGSRDVEDYRLTELKKWLIIELNHNKDIHLKLKPRK